MQAYPFDVYDIDGTLTVPGDDLWYLCTRSLSADKDLFDNYVAEWKSEIQSGMNPFERSLTMMKRGLALLKDGVSSELVTGEVQRIACNLIDEGLVCREAINFLKGRIRSGVRAVFSTANYHEGAVGFLHALLRKDWLQETEVEKIFVSGSRIDWSSGECCSFQYGQQQSHWPGGCLRNQQSGIAGQDTLCFRR